MPPKRHKHPCQQVEAGEIYISRDNTSLSSWIFDGWHSKSRLRSQNMHFNSCLHFVSTCQRMQMLQSSLFLSVSEYLSIWVRLSRHSKFAFRKGKSQKNSHLWVGCLAFPLIEFPQHEICIEGIVFLAVSRLPFPIFTQNLMAIYVRLCVSSTSLFNGAPQTGRALKWPCLKICKWN